MWLHALFLLLFIAQSCWTLTPGDPAVPVWPMERPSNMPEITMLDVMCYTNKMAVTLEFSVPFNGIVFSKGSYGHQQCVYVAANSARTAYKFDILYDQCGTKPDLQGKFYENTIVIQYEKDLIELWDEAKRLRCEWANDYRQLTESMPAVKIDDLTVIELNFQGDNVDCWMEIQEGKGPFASHVSGIVPIGSALTLVVAISDPSGEFDMMVRSCVAHDGVKQPLPLTDERGCILRPKMFSQFFKMRSKSGRASQITYAHFSAFKFPDTMQVNIQCKVVICRHGCPAPCSPDSLDIHGFVQKIGQKSSGSSGSGGGMPRTPDNGISVRQDIKDRSSVEKRSPPKITARAGEESVGSPKNTDAEDKSYFPSSLDNDNSKTTGKEKTTANDSRSVTSSTNAFPFGPRSFAAGKQKSARRSRSLHDDKELHVSQSYQAISRTDLAFAPNASTDTVSIYSGRKSGVADNYGVCLSVPSFGALFASLGMFAVTAVLVAVVCGYHYRKFEDDKRTNMNGKLGGAHVMQTFNADFRMTDHVGGKIIHMTSLSK